jgi:hypothetical protein
MSFSPAASFDVYQDVTGTSYAEFIEYLTSFVSFVVNVLALVVLTRLTSLKTLVMHTHPVHTFTSTLFQQSPVDNLKRAYKRFFSSFYMLQ